jgi:hypothetical protein
MDDHENNTGGSGEDVENLQAVCPCCFDLNATLVDSTNDHVRVDQSEFVVAIGRDDGQFRRAAADNGCESCGLILRALE